MKKQNECHEFKNTVKPDNFQIALRRFYSFERKLEKDDLLRQQVNKHIHEMEKKDYIRKLNQSSMGRRRGMQRYIIKHVLGQRSRFTNFLC